MMMLFGAAVFVGCSGYRTGNLPQAQPSLSDAALPTSPQVSDSNTIVPTAELETPTHMPPSPTRSSTRTRTPSPTHANPVNTPTALPVARPTLAPTGSSSPGDAVLVGAGDMRQCNKGLEQVAALINTIPGTVVMLGDATNTGAPSEYPCYDKAWGRFKDRTLPVIGNHEYETKGAPGYFGYFGDAAHPPTGYYSTDVGSWHVIVLNSNCGQAGGCQKGSTQEKWLAADLAAHPNQCTLAMWHHPRFNSGKQGSSVAVSPFWQDLQEAGVHLVLNGHEHNYERFARQDLNGIADPNGIREFIVGTGGAAGGGWVNTLPNSEVHAVSVLGAIKLTLHTTSYDWEFIPVPGATFTDAGSESCF